MKKLFVLSLALILSVVPAYALGTRPQGVTGDRGFDSALRDLSVSANADPDGYYRELSARNGIPEQDLRQAKDRYGLNYSDLYMASALAKATRRPVLDVAEDYHKNQGKGWGVMAKELGIKPGSDQFHAMKAGALRSLDHMKAEAKNKQKHEQAVAKENEQKGEKAKQDGQGKAKQEQKAEQDAQGKAKQEQKANQNAQNKGQGNSR